MFYNYRNLINFITFYRDILKNMKPFLTAKFWNLDLSMNFADRKDISLLINATKCEFFKTTL